MTSPVITVLGAKLIRPTIADMLFGSGEQGAWYDPSDLSTLFQDSAGTTPVTAVEQPVGLMLDKSGRGNHASQATSTKRPIYSRRVNLLTKTEQFADAIWVKSGLGMGSAPSVTSNAALAPDGTLTADHVTLAIGGSTSSSDWSWLYHNLLRTAGVPENFAIWVKAATPADIGRTVVLSGGSMAAVTLSADWVMHEFSALVTDSVTFSYGVRLRGNETPGATDVSFHLWGASLVLATDAHLPYQWVNTATDYDADPAKFPGYLRFDGVDDALQTGNIDFTGTDKMTVWAGVEALGTDVGPIVVHPDFGAHSFQLLSPGFSAGVSVHCASAGTNAIPAQSLTPLVGPTILTGAADIAADYVGVSVNGGSEILGAGDQGTGNYSNGPVYIGGNGAAFFKGSIYSIIARGAATPLPQIEAVENLIRRTMRLP